MFDKSCNISEKNEMDRCRPSNNDYNIIVKDLIHSLEALVDRLAHIFEKTWFSS